MRKIATYVFFDIETTGLPHQQRNRTKIVELSFVAASRKDVEKCLYKELPPVSKLTFVFNPQMRMQSKVVEMTGLSNESLIHAPIFRHKINSIVTFLEELEKPVCLVAHNGNVFDFKLLLAEFNDAARSLPQDLLCVDSIIGFRKILKDTTIDYRSLESLETSAVLNVDDFLTDDEDEWSELNVSTEEWREIDDLCVSLSDVSCEDFTEAEELDISKCERNDLISKKTKAIEKVFAKKPVCNKGGYSLSALYKRLLNKEEDNAHRAEVDCFMLLQCVVAVKKDFVPWADEACKKLTEIQPLVRY